MARARFAHSSGLADKDGWRDAIASVAERVTRGVDEGGQRVLEAVSECAVEVDRHRRVAASLEWELHRANTRARALAEALDASLECQRLTGLRVERNGPGVGDGIKAWCHVLEGRVAALSQQVKRCPALKRALMHLPWCLCGGKRSLKGWVLY